MFLIVAILTLEFSKQEEALVMLVLRFSHVFFGALWVGMMFFTVFFVAPAAAEAGAEGGKLMAALQRRRVMVIMPIFALITIVSGFWMMNRVAAGNWGPFMRTPMGQSLAWGATAALAAFLLGIIVMRPAMMKAAKLAESLATVPAEERAVRMVEMQRLRARGSVMGKVVAVLLLIALGLMAVARYV